ncbi:MAG: DUF2723 domain-containing protein [Bacteroidales bacterium]|nr:DUF2723 domain-containing protein [Bacteroidales bacterium]
MKNFKLLNNVFGWFAFLVAAVTYLLTIEPTTSFWDCGEFISSAYKLDVGHPPGAPFFMLTGRFFANFASSPEQVALMLNAMSALFSALTILFLFWSITHLARKVVVKDKDNMKPAEIITVLGAGLVGALAYTFSDTFWFSAVEGEVYAYSSLFTAVVFWAILKWEEDADNPHSLRWIIFISYLMGLSIGVHLLNLLCIPALVLVFYFRKNQNSNFKGAALALLGSFVLIAIVLYGVVPGFVNMAGWADLLFVNVLGFGFNTGAVVYILVMIATICWGLIESYRGKNEFRMKLVFALNIILSGIPFFSNSPWIWLLLCGLTLVVVFMWKKLDGKLINTSLLALMVMLIGYFSYGVTVIRSSAQPPMDQNSPNNMFTLERYLNREQYGETPLIYGQTFVSDIAWKRQGNVCVPQYKKKGPVWNKEVKTSADQKDRYIISGYNERPVMADELNMFFPRMHSNKPEHVLMYKDWVNFKGSPVKYNKCGQVETVYKPTMSENLRFFFSYQVNFMYWRYFMWNFAGRQNDIQGLGEANNGNWISGINFIDKYLVGDQSNLPPELANNKARNRYYMLPLLLGILGLLYQAYAGKKGLQGFWITFLLFFMTGLAIVLYLNQTPLQPRERDYAYAGSFYAFCIWIGLGVPALVNILRKALKPVPAAFLAGVLGLGVPVLMASENWDDHDRSDRYTARDFAYNYLIGCEENSIIYTNGDNDTFPLWYLQEVEGIRTDVRVCNLSYLQTDWYYDQMLRPYYESDAFPLSWHKSKYSNGKRDIARIIPRTQDTISLPFAMNWLARDEPNTKRVQGYGDNVDHIPANRLYLDIDAEKVLENGYLEPKYAQDIISRMHINLEAKNYLGKHEIMTLKLLEENNWERSMYYAVTVDPAQMTMLQRYFLHEGLIYKIAPLESNKSVNTEKMYDNMVNKFLWGGIKENPTIYLDENNLRMCRTHRQMFGYLVRALYQEGKHDMALQAIDKCLEELPVEHVPVNFIDGGMAGMIEIADVLYQLGEKQRAKAIADQGMDLCVQNLSWFFNLRDQLMRASGRSINNQLYVMQELMKFYQKAATDSAGIEEPGEVDQAFAEDFTKYSQYFNQFIQQYQRLR